MGLDLRSGALLIGTFYKVAVAIDLLIDEVAGLRREGNADGDGPRTGLCQGAVKQKNESTLSHS